MDTRRSRVSARTGADEDTRRKLLVAAGEVFAAKGFRGATVREVCARAGVNIAAVNYHFGSKEALYTAALREALVRVNAAANPYPDPPASRGDIPRFLEEFVTTIVERVLSPRDDWKVRLFRRELDEPTVALDAIVNESMRPVFAFLRDALAPHVPEGSDASLHALSVIGQVVYYRCASPIATRLLGIESYDERFATDLARHVARFSARALGVGA
jgi:AcrR family transcriptional regulator